MRVRSAFFGCLALAACAAPVPDSGPRGVGFEDYNTYIAQQQAAQRARDAELAQSSTSQQTIGGAPVRAGTAAEQTANDALVAVGRTPTNQDDPIQEVGQTYGGPVQTASTTPVQTQNNPDISDEQDFGAVSSRETIESDAQRRQSQQQQYTQVAPSNLPNRPNNLAPTPIEFALSTSHPVGQRVYRRGLGGAAKAERECAKYNTEELAQDAFLRAGGPQKDKIGLDPDGDGYACNWNPGTYRRLGQG